MELIDWAETERESTCLYLSISGSWTHQVGLISETFSWDMSQLGLRSEAVIVYWFRLGCSVQFWELLLQSTDCNDGEPSMWQHWLHQPVSVATFHLKVVFIRCVRTAQTATASIGLCQCSYRDGLFITDGKINNLTVSIPLIYSFIYWSQCLIKKQRKEALE